MKQSDCRMSLTLFYVQQQKMLSIKVISVLFISLFYFYIIILIKVYTYNNAGYTIPKGWNMIVLLRYVHVDPNNYDDPLCFNPDRWDVSQMLSIIFFSMSFSSDFKTKHIYVLRGQCCLKTSKHLALVQEPVQEICSLVYNSPCFYIISPRDTSINLFPK